MCMTEILVSSPHPVEALSSSRAEQSENKFPYRCGKTVVNKEYVVFERASFQAVAGLATELAEVCNVCGMASLLMET